MTIPKELKITFWFKSGLPNDRLNKSCSWVIVGETGYSYKNKSFPWEPRLGPNWVERAKGSSLPLDLHFFDSLSKFYLMDVLTAKRTWLISLKSWLNLPWPNDLCIACKIYGYRKSRHVQSFPYILYILWLIFLLLFTLLFSYPFKNYIYWLGWSH